MTLTLAQSIVVAILAFSTFFCGWFFYRLRAKAREAELQKVVLETKGMIPQLETTVRSREQRIAALLAEIGDWKARVPVLEAGIKDKEREVLARDRALRALNTELTLLKDSAAEAATQVVAQPVVDEEAHTELRDRLAASEQRCTELADQLAKAGTAPPQVASADGAGSSNWSDQSARIQALEAELVTRDRALADFEERLRAESAHGHTLVQKLDAQDAQIQLEREESAKWRARVPKLIESLKERDDRIAQIEPKIAALEAARAEAVARGDELDSELTVSRAARLAAEAETIGAHAATRAAQDATKAADDRAAALAADVERLRSRQSELEAALAEQTRTVAARDERIAALGVAADESRKEFAKKLATSIRLGREEIDRMNTELGAEVDRLTRELGVALTRRNDADEALAEMRGRFEAERQRVAELQVAALDAANLQRAASERIDELDGALVRADERTRMVEVRAAALDDERLQAVARMGELEAAVRAARAETEVAAAETAAVHKRQLGLDAECDHLRQRLAEAAADQRASFERARELEAECDQLRRHAAEIEGAHHASVERVRDLEVKLEAAQADAEAMSGAASTAANARLSGLEAECDHLRRRLAETEGDLRASLERIGVREADLEEAQSRVVPLEGLVKQRDETLQERAARIEALKDQVATLEASLDRGAERIAALEREAAAGAVARMPPNEKVEYLQQRVAVQFEKNREITLALEDRERKLAELERDRTLKDKSLIVLQQQLEHLAQTNDRLSIEVRDLKQREAQSDATSTIAPEEHGSGIAPEGDGSGIAPLKPQGLFASRPDEVDELQQIRGIGAAFEHRLNSLGIYQLKQIAALNEAEIVWLENELRVFRGRIGRDDWLGQALDLIARRVWHPGPSIDVMAGVDRPIS